MAGIPPGYVLTESARNEPGVLELCAASSSASMEAWFVYVIRTAGGALYTGITTDVERRLETHCAGRGAKYLRGRGPLALVYWRKLGERGLALRIERRLKRWSKAEKEALVEAAPSRRRLLRLLEIEPSWVDERIR